MSIRHGIAGFVIRRLLLGLVTLWITSVIIFAATQALPGDAARSILGRSATPESLEALRQQLGLDEPVLTQYWEWISGVLTGDLGTSLANSLPVTEVLSDRLVYSLFLMVLAGVISVPLGILLGAMSASRRDSAFDQTTSVATLGLARSAGVRGRHHAGRPVLDDRLPLASGRGRDGAGRGPVALPEGAHPAGRGPRHRRRPLHGTDHARVDGGDPRERLRRDGAVERAAGAARPLAPRGPERAGADVPGHRAEPRVPRGGIVVVEAVFNYPGVGLLLVDSVRGRDMPVVQAMALLIAALYVVLNLLADLATILVSPRLRTSLS